jgi:hypothetical protein
MKRLTSVAKSMMKEVESGGYARYGVTSLAGCRPVHLLQRGGGRQGVAEGAPGAALEEPLSLEPHIAAWW